ncbi:hypothetical protein L195_g005486 [Trifolium pratense]|uniref:KxDL domain-containing protein n=1 Tax=Trifolium pratense TaxID=57577 RepID=A0A2K3P0X2_TRIPR|nr:hypothetical protein L195_g005486 [Trifolium pratense]
MSEKESESESMKLGSEELSSEFKTLVSSDDLRSLNHLQHTILGRLQDSNAVLSHFNDFSQHCFSEISGDMGRNTRVLKSIKTDLDYIFLKLRIDIRGKQARQVLEKQSNTRKVMPNVEDEVVFGGNDNEGVALGNMKTKLLTTYPDAFPEDSMSTVIDRRPDLEMPK